MIAQAGPDWYLGNGHCLEGLRELPDHCASTILTDPPYSSGARRDADKAVFGKTMSRTVKDTEAWFSSDSLTVAGFTWLMNACAVEWRRVLKPGGHILCFIDWRMAPHCAAAIEAGDLKHCSTLVWDKTYFGLGSCFRKQHELILHFTNGQGREPSRRNQGEVLRCKPVRSRDADHPTEKPVALLRRLLSVVGRPGDLVIDCFSGSGATGAAALSMGQRFVGWERVAKYYSNAATRLTLAAQLGATPWSDTETPDDAIENVSLVEGTPVNEVTT